MFYHIYIYIWEEIYIRGPAEYLQSAEVFFLFLGPAGEKFCQKKVLGRSMTYFLNGLGETRRLPVFLGRLGACRPKSEKSDRIFSDQHSLFLSLVVT